MHRFRKKSDAKRPNNLHPVSVAESVDSSRELYETIPAPTSAPDSLPELPSSSDFRTSLILTDLSRRFTLLSAVSTESASVDALRLRLASQRARGAENQISEEEEDMVLSTLGLGSKQPTGDEFSVASTSNTSLSSKRYSNNLFGSNRFRDYSYIRSVQSKASSIRTMDSTRTHTASHDSLAGPSETNETSVESQGVRSAPLIAPAPYGGQPLSVAEYRLSKSLGHSGLRRASLALEEAIKAIEEEAEDEIVMPRSAPITRGSFDRETREPDNEAGMAISSDKHISLEPDSPRASPIPSRTMPGYVPGMPRPMTPRDTSDFDEQRSYSTTPRASSPTVVSPSPIVPSRQTTLPPSHSPRPKSPNVLASSPIFLQRSLNGRYTPEEPQHADSDATASLPWRRPTSPLSTASFQPLAVPVRPTTPSNVTWTPNGNPRHNRDGSWASDFSEASPSRSVRSPALPDSPLMGPGHTNMNSFSSTFSSTSSVDLPRPMSSISGVDLGSPVMGGHRPLRSPTPTQITSRSPTSGTFSLNDASPKNGSRRSSNQNTPSTPFTLGPFQPLFSPIANSSRSSLESAGSSFHSWDVDRKDQTASLFADGEVPRPIWHEISSANGQQNSDSPNSFSDDGEAEEIIFSYAGLNKVDFQSIQEKLVTAAVAKTAPVELQPRRSPSLRRRRPSTSQSNYSLNNGRIISPSPTAVGQTFETYPGIMNGIFDGFLSPTAPVDTSGEASPNGQAPSPTRRARDLTHVLFGENSAQVLTVGGGEHAQVPNSAPLDASFPHTEVPPSSASATWPYPISRNPSTPRLPQSAEEHAELAREVQRKTEAAMVMLQKQPSTSNLALPHKPPTARKRISPSQISTPQLVSASTSVDTIPLPSPALGGGPSKIGSRLQRLRGSLRAKTMPTAEDVTPFPMELRSPPAVQSARYDPVKVRPPGAPIPASATTEVEGFRVPIPSPPASAGPGLKGIIARFRGKQRASETGAEPDVRRMRGPLPHLSPTSTDNFHSTPSGWPSHSLNRSPSDSSPPESAGYLRSPSSATTPTHLDQSTMASRQVTAPLYSPRHHVLPSIETTSADENDAIRQLFDAASNLGLDQGALNDLLARSGSTRSTDWAGLSRNNSKSASRPGNHKSHIPSAPPPPPPETPPQPDHLRRPKEGGNEKSPVVRRTIIYASDTRASTIDVSALVRKQSSRRRRASATSVSSRSIHDRVPTPPPVKSASGRRFSTDNPPVPLLPGSKPNRLLIPPVPNTGSNYDSLYDMYAEKPGLSPATDRGPTVPEPLPAVEVVEFENGETIWSIVNGLRDADDYAEGFNRTSFGSDYSIRDTGNDGMQVFFREHGRKNSGSSFLQRKKTLTAAAKSRPETKVYYSSPTEIGRLIETISSGTEAGSFNILANRPVHSAASSVSEADWTVEDRIEHLLAGVRR
ncbi:hypothetical protein MIND_01044000 [Mycena indigotica]|uniref:Uncharacterized protein n=1 Tax=Mycena indigotica TaxID=2126181 RepID=A0A8H6S9Z7_9AGAR|nr:uncharacterized protein MIND_01044000 [Mycena indigotica]KAF7295058.1 hypothetical protein MIND_01044000 [Mycena indigotica]